MADTKFGENTEILWHDRKRWCGLPWSFTRYYIVKKKDSWTKFFSSIGLFSNVEEEVYLFRIFDISIYQSLSNKIFNVGNIILHCNDESQEEIIIYRVKNPYKVRNLIAGLVEDERKRNNFHLGEFH